MNLQSLLAERRATVLEQARETNKTARALLQFRIDQIDRELHERQTAWRPADEVSQ